MLVRLKRINLVTFLQIEISYSLNWVLTYSNGRHGVGGDEDGDALSEGDDGAHNASEGPVVQHEPDLNITFYESFNIADLTFLVIIAIQKLYLCDVWPPHTLKVRQELFTVEKRKHFKWRGTFTIISSDLPLTHHGEGNVEGCHEEVAQCEVSYEEVGDGVQSPGPDDHTEH